MGNYRDEIERFIYEICYQPIWASVSEYVSQHLSLLDLTYSRVKYQDSAYVEDMLLEFTKNVRIDDNSLLFDAVVSCTMNLTEENYRGMASCDLNQWFLVSCEAVIEDSLKSLIITNVQQYVPGMRQRVTGQAVSKNIVPILYKKDLEDEASAHCGINYHSDFRCVQRTLLYSSGLLLGHRKHFPSCMHHDRPRNHHLRLTALDIAYQMQLKYSAGI